MTTHIDVSPELRRTGRRLGYGIAVVVNLAMLVALQFVPGWLPFITDAFDTVVPWISLSLIAAIVANLVYQVDDTTTVKSTGQTLVNLISLFVTYRVFEVFPFDFSAYDFDWALVTRVMLILGMVGSGVGVVAETVKLTSVGSKRPAS